MDNSAQYFHQVFRRVFQLTCVLHLEPESTDPCLLFIHGLQSSQLQSIDTGLIEAEYLHLSLSLDVTPTKCEIWICAYCNLWILVQLRLSTGPCLMFIRGLQSSQLQGIDNRIEWGEIRLIGCPGI